MTPNPPVVPNRWRFGQFEFDASTRELRKNGLRLHIQEQPARVLCALLERPGEVVSREELQELLWAGDTFVDFERSLNATVAKLRQVLSDSAEQPRYVETIARRGYQFVAPVEAYALPGRENNRSGWGLTVGAIALFALTSPYLLNWREANPISVEGAKFFIAPPEGTRIHPISAISPDGRRIAFVAMDATGQSALWVRPLASERAIRLEHTDGARAPFFSPDSDHIGFFADGKVKRIPAAGGSPHTICDQRQPGGGTWNHDNVIVFSQAGRLHRVSAAGGPPTELTRPPAKAGENMVDFWPQFLPDGKRFIVSSSVYNGHFDPVRSGLLIGSLDSNARRLLLPNVYRAAATTSGHLLFMRRGVLYAQKMDNKPQLTGEPWPVAEGLTFSAEGLLVEMNPGMPITVLGAGFSVSNHGALVYHTYSPPLSQLVWVDRTGKRLSTVGELHEYSQLALSPNEKWAAVGIRDSNRRDLNQNIWLMNLETSVLSRLSYGEGADGDPVWAPDSRRLVFGAFDTKKGPQIEILESMLGGFPRPFFADGHANKPEAWSHDGQILLIRRDERFVYKISLIGERKTSAVIETPALRGRFSFSPDGRSVAYMSTESGRDEIYMSNFPAMDETRQVSTNGGMAPIWRGDGKELLYMTRDNKLMSVPLRGSPTPTPGPPQLLFQAAIARNSANMGQYGVTANGQRFLISEVLPTPMAKAGLHVITHWNGSPSN